MLPLLLKTKWRPWPDSQQPNWSRDLSHTGCNAETREKMCPLLTATGPSGYIQSWIVDLERKAVRCCFYLHDTLLAEYVLPIDVDVPMWDFTQKFVKVALAYGVHVFYCTNCCSPAYYAYMFYFCIFLSFQATVFIKLQ